MPHLTNSDVEKFVVDSGFSQEEWERGVDHYQKWAQKNSREYLLSDALEYIACCAELAGKHPALVHLDDVVEEMLETHGVDPVPSA